MKKTGCAFAIGLLLVVSQFAAAEVNITVEATDVNALNTVRVESIIPNPFGPASLIIKANPSAEAFAEFDLLNGAIRLLADDSGNLIKNGSVSAGANINAFRLENISGNTIMLSENAFEINFESTHLVDGTPENTGMGTGEKTAYIRYLLFIHAIKSGPGGSQDFKTGITQNRMTVVWNEDGSFKERTFEELPDGTVDGWIVKTPVFEDKRTEISIASPSISVGPGELINFRATVLVFADSGNEGLNAKVDAMSTGKMALKIPHGIEFSDLDDDLGPLGGLEYVDDRVDCDETYVQLNPDALVVDVTPTGVDDTGNIQCALDMAIDAGLPVVRLAASTFIVSNLIAEDFNGTLEGRSKTTTIIQVTDGSVDCAGMEVSGRTPAVIKFVSGEPRIRFLTINAHLPCVNDGPIQTILHFTGEDVFVENCANDVIFARVDRVILDGTEASTGPRSAIRASAEGNYDVLGGCKDTLLGTLKVNRNDISNTYEGVRTSFKSGGQVDVNFSNFKDNLKAVYLHNTNQNTTIVNNSFLGSSTVDESYFGIHLFTEDENAPTVSRMVANKNIFTISSPMGGQASYGIGASQPGRVANISSVITNNSFVLDGDLVYAVQFADVSNAHVSTNIFSGFGARAIHVMGNGPVTGWTIAANNITDFTIAKAAHILLDTTTSECIVGPAQDMIVQDDGMDNTILN